MKTNQQKQQEAYDRLVKSTYENSKAKRNGVSQETWQFNKDKMVALYNERGIK